MCRLLSGLLPNVSREPFYFCIFKPWKLNNITGLQDYFPLEGLVS